MRFEDDIIEKLLELKWWEYGPNVMSGLSMSNVGNLVYQLEERIYNQGFPKYNPECFAVDPQKQIIRRID